MELLYAIERLAPVEALKASFYVYPLVNALHIAALGAVWTSVVLIDLRVLGWLAGFDARDFERTFRRIALGAFAVAVLTGLSLFSVRASEYVTNPAFLTKLALILLAGANLLVFMRWSGAAPASRRAQAALSIALWSAVLVCGRFIGFL